MSTPPSVPQRPQPDAPYDRLAPLPRSTWLPAVVNSVGRDGARLSDLGAWHVALNAGDVPPLDADFGDAEAVRPLCTEVAALDLPTLSRTAPSLTEQVLRTALWHLDRLIDRPNGQTRAVAIARMIEAFRAEWQRDKADWEQLLALLPDAGDLAQLTRDERRGLLHSRGWAEAERLAGVLRARADLAALIRRIGRHDITQAAPPAADAVSGAGMPHGVHAVVTKLPGAPGELHGIALGDQIERMTPAEAQQLLHPVLRKLWRARRAEARLLHYDSSAEVIDWRPDRLAAPRAAAAVQSSVCERGPMIVALDTSGSMRGAPETIAKAVVLEAMRVTREHRRGLRLIAFGAAGEVLERDLGDGVGGVTALLDLLGQAFDGGTDVQAPIEAAARALHDRRWQNADLLIVSDGEFGCTPAALATLDAARERFGLRVHGVLIGDRETIGLMQVADEIFWVRDWRHERPGTGAFSPVHSKSLTALFFPNALDERARRHGTPSSPSR